MCDVDEARLLRAVEEVRKQAAPAPPAFGDFRKLLELKELELKEIDAVMIATPDHWHAIPSVHAFQAGKDVFVEKPLSYSIGEWRAMRDAARKHNRVSQLGNHMHNDAPNYRRVVKIVRSGMLGDIHKVSCWVSRDAGKGVGNPPDSDPPAGLDYDFWLGPAPKRPYNPNRSHGRFRHFWDCSGGLFIDFWCHITDLPYWALNLAAPKCVSAAGGRYLADDNGETRIFSKSCTSTRVW